MKVQHLIAYLETLPANLEVKILGDDEEYHDVEAVSVEGVPHLTDGMHGARVMDQYAVLL